MKSVTNQRISRTLRDIADALEIEEENPFRIRAYRTAAQSIDNLPQPLADIYDEGGLAALEALRGIGTSIAAKIEELLTTGALEQLEEISEDVPAELRELVNLPGLGPRKVQRLHEELGVSSLDDLERACKGARVRQLTGFGEKSEAKLLAGIDSYRRHRGRLRIDEAEAVLEELLPHLRAVEGVRSVEPAGSYRRRRETVGDLDILVTSDESARVMEAFIAFPAVEEVPSRGDTRSSVVLDNGLQVDLRLLEPSVYGAALMYFTGSKEHNIQLRTLAKARGYKTSEYGLFEGESRIAGRSEGEIYARLGLQWIPPELRERQGEIEAAGEGKLPELIELEQIRGDLQMHTYRSDGRNSPGEMGRAARELGYDYIAITEHSKAVTVARGLDDEELLA
jgi:DNA polymerase (family 10)